MKANSCVLVGMDWESAAVARAAFQEFFPNAEVVTLPNLDEVFSRRESDQTELLIVSNASESELQRALQTTDYFGLPRWAIVVIGANDNPPTNVTPGDWTPTTARRSMHQALQQAQLARQNARLRGDLLSLGQRVTHDMRTPLGAIASYAELVKEVLTDHSAEDAQLVNPLLNSVDDLSKLVTRLSFLLKASAKPLPLEPVAMAEVFWRISQRFERALLQRKMTLKQPEQWPEVLGVAGWLEEVWSNLIQNAMRFGTEGSTITLNWRQHGANYEFTVHNEGESVPPEQRAMLFQPFHSLHRPSARRGFGLSIVQRLVELQGGSCFYEAETTNGSTFGFTLPTVRAETTTANPSIATAAH